MTNISNNNDEPEDEQRFSTNLDDIRLWHSHPSSGDWIPHQKKIYEKDVNEFSKKIIRRFENKAEKSYEHELIQAVGAKRKPKSKTQSFVDILRLYWLS